MNDRTTAHTWPAEQTERPTAVEAHDRFDRATDPASGPTEPILTERARSTTADQPAGAAQHDLTGLNRARARRQPVLTGGAMLVRRLNRQARRSRYARHAGSWLANRMWWTARGAHQLGIVGATGSSGSPTGPIA